MEEPSSCINTHVYTLIGLGRGTRKAPPLLMVPGDMCAMLYSSPPTTFSCGKIIGKHFSGEATSSAGLSFC
jgi:hypothetical protein